MVRFWPFPTNELQLPRKELGAKPRRRFSRRLRMTRNAWSPCDLLPAAVLKRKADPCSWRISVTTETRRQRLSYKVRMVCHGVIVQSQSTWKLEEAFHFRSVIVFTEEALKIMGTQAGLVAKFPEARNTGDRPHCALRVLRYCNPYNCHTSHFHRKIYILIVAV